MTGLFYLIGAIVVIAIVIMSVLKFVATNYIKVAPNEAKVFYGRKYINEKGEKIGFKVVTGGARFKIPIIESVGSLSLNVFTLALNIKKAPNINGVPVNLKGVANVKISSKEGRLMLACERFLHKPQEEIESTAYQNLEGHLRGIAGRMTIEQLIGDKTMLNQAALDEASQELNKLGFDIETVVIQEVSDDSEYIDQLGKKKTAEVKRDAEIGKAEAERETTIKTKKKLDIQQANFTAEVSKQQAISAQAGPLSTAEAMKAVVTAEQETAKTKVEKQTEVAVAEAKRKEQQLIAEVIKPAEAAKIAAELVANQNKQVKITEADGEQQQIQKLAEAAKQKAKLEGEGQGAADQARMEGEAAGIKAKKLAEAEGDKAIGLAQAAVIEAKLLAEAKGIEKKAEAYAKLDESGRLLQILEALQTLVPATVKEFAGVMEAAAKPLGNVDNISIVDFGSGNATGKFGGTVPGMIAELFAKANVSGFDLSGLAKKLGIDPSKFLGKAGLGDTPTA
ncbi:MAG: Band 7 protein [Candidatus Nomurabacteria bacterium GW2011_GWB1_37_5]|uniref:Band 7 protein n=1 Tax=Candidatus Nomurabacteria bacterium GW2011_GWB1_37_5 TaxID=1618742 RepID=A0A0G0H869_9BACT|nr:MAG: Band 7 protein [Candidatus Nomurabacteria bacterium GW2011_GWB1_37_5]